MVMVFKDADAGEKCIRVGIMKMQCSNATLQLALPVAVNQTLTQLAPVLRRLHEAHVPRPTQDSTLFAALMRMYSVSYMWYAVIGTVVCVVVGISVGLLTASDEDAFDERLLHPLVAKLARRMPGKKRKFTSRADDVPEEKESSEKTDETTVEDPSPKQPTLTSHGSRLFDAYEANEPPSSKTRL